MSLPSAVEEAAARVKRIRLSLDGRSLSEDSASAEGSSGQGGPAGPAAGDAAAPSSPQSEDRAAGDGARGDSGGDSGGGNSGSDGQDPGCALRRTKSLARLRAEDFAAQQTSADGAASAGCLAQDVMQFLRTQQLADLCTMLVSDPLSWELWAFGELNATLSANFSDLASFALTPLQAYPQVPPRPALDAFLKDVPRGPAARLLHVLLHRTFHACDEVEIVRYRYKCPPCLAAWARRHRVAPAAAQLFAVTGVDSASGEACTLYVPHIPAMQRPTPAPHADAGDSTAERCAAGEAAAAAERAADAQPQQQCAEVMAQA